MPPKSNLWQYFTRCQDKKFAICRLCSKQIKTSGNTTNLKCHLQVMHKHILEKSRGLPLQTTIKKPKTQNAVPSTSSGSNQMTDSTNTDIDTDTSAISTAHESTATATDTFFSSLFTGRNDR